MANRLALCMVLALAACSDGGSGREYLDAPSGPACTGALYDPCTDNAQCMSTMCHEYQSSGFTVCTQSCSASNPCPADKTGTPATCNNMGRCKPAGANNCTR